MKESEGQKSGGNLKDSQGNKVEVVWVRDAKKGSLNGMHFSDR